MEKPNYRLGYVDVGEVTGRVVSSVVLRKSNPSHLAEKTFGCSCNSECSCDSQCDCNVECRCDEYVACRHCRCVDNCSCVDNVPCSCDKHSCSCDWDCNCNAD